MPTEPPDLITVYDIFPDWDRIPPDPEWRTPEAFPDILEPVFWDTWHRYAPFTAIGTARFYNIFTAVKHIAEINVHCDFVECGVFLGAGIKMQIAWEAATHAAIYQDNSVGAPRAVIGRPAARSIDARRASDLYVGSSE
jgi:hypothetical protein